MKTDRLEELFQEKFSDLRVEPTERAKSRFEEKLTFRNRWVWMKRISIAASFLIIAIAGTWILSPSNEESVISKRSNIVSGEIDLSKTSNDDKGMNNTQIADIKEEKKKKEVLIIKEKSEKTSEYIAEIPLQSIQDPIETIDLPIEKELLVENETEMVPDTMPEPGMIINEIESETFATVEKEKRSGEPVKITIEYIAGNSGQKGGSRQVANMKEFYNKVNDLLYPDDVLGGIRSLKDQIFVFDLKNVNKTETQNTEKK
jgi:hypothetical protein